MDPKLEIFSGTVKGLLFNRSSKELKFDLLLFSCFCEDENKLLERADQPQ